jgi:uncharacterized protein (TIGR02452 family)
MTHIRFLPCLDSDAMAEANKAVSWMDRDQARALGQSAMEALETGVYFREDDELVDWSDMIKKARTSRVSIAGKAPLPKHDVSLVEDSEIQVINTTSLKAAQGLIAKGLRPLVLNFANGIGAGGGFLSGARAQEEGLCRSSALFAALKDDAMYAYHRTRPHPDSSDWCILTPDVPVFRDDAGHNLDEPWLVSFITSAAPYAPKIGQPQSGDLLRNRIHRVLAIASAYGYRSLVLGAWGCGAFHNDPQRTAEDFHAFLMTEFRGHFSHIVFAITDWSPERKMLGPFRDVFSGE